MATNTGLSNDAVHNHGVKLYITGTVFVILAGIFVGIRLVVRQQKHAIGKDDLTITLSLLFSILLTVFMNLAVNHGYGRHKWDLTKPELRAAMENFYLAQVFYKVVIMLNKMSIILLYLRVFINKNFRRLCYATMLVVFVWSVGSIAATIFQCIPVEAAWNKSIKTAKCTDSNAAWLQYAVINIVTDIIIFALPVREVSHLLLPKREKFGLIFVFLLGAFVCVVSIVRVVAVANSTKNKADVTGSFVLRSTLTMVEANTGIICACLPMLRQPLAFLFPRQLSSKGKYYYQHRQQPTPAGLTEATEHSTNHIRRDTISSRMKTLMHRDHEEKHYELDSVSSLPENEIPGRSSSNNKNEVTTHTTTMPPYHVSVVPEHCGASEKARAAGKSLHSYGSHEAPSSLEWEEGRSRPSRHAKMSRESDEERLFYEGDLETGKVPQGSHIQVDRSFYVSRE